MLHYLIIYLHYEFEFIQVLYYKIVKTETLTAFGTLSSQIKWSQGYS